MELIEETVGQLTDLDGEGLTTAVLEAPVEAEESVWGPAAGLESGRWDFTVLFDARDDDEDEDDDDGDYFSDDEDEDEDDLDDDEDFEDDEFEDDDEEDEEDEDDDF
jgi:hypothetical protein